MLNGLVNCNMVDQISNIRIFTVNYQYKPVCFNSCHLATGQAGREEAFHAAV